VQDVVPNPNFATQCPCGMTLFGAYEPAGLMYIARGIAQGVLPWDSEVAKVLYACTLCGYCEDLCGRGYRHTPAIAILEELRRIIPEHLKPKNLLKANEACRNSARHKLAMLRMYDLPDPSNGGKVDTVLFTDKAILNDGPKLKEIGYLLQKSGKRIGCFSREPLPPVDTTLLNSGAWDILEQSIQEIDRRLETHGIKQVICYNPESLSVLRRFSKIGVPFVPITSLWAEMLKKKPFKKLKTPLVTYQDPCHLGRYTKEYVVPRQVINGLGLKLKEMWRTRNNALCCGAGGDLLASNPTLAKTYAANRWEEARATGAKVIITACPYCDANLRRTKPRNSRVVDITSLVAEAFGYKGKAVAQ
jgi:Fe-S oxidoreductase